MCAKLKNFVAVLEKTLEKLFLFLISWFQKHLCVKKPVCFSIFEIIDVYLFSLRFKTTESQTKNFIFCSVSFCFIFSFNIFSLITVVFVHFLFSSFCSSLCAFLFFCFSCFLICFFLHRRFCVSSFCFDSIFLLSLLFLISFLFSSFFFHLRIRFFAQTDSKISVVNFFRRNGVFDF